MAFYRITYNEKYRFATLHNYGCTFHCSFCSYKLRSGANGRPGFAEPKPEKFLTVEEQKAALKKVDIDKLYFMGGEPTVAPELPEMLHFAKTELNVMTKLGHTNGSKLPLPYLDGANVGFKAWSDELHLEITGRPKSLIYDNFQRAFDAGL
ncbi:MAG: radical SAM protein, partial [Victivallaceae bacterium]